MAYLAGIVLALAVSAFATAIRLDRDRAFYPIVLMIVASYYVLFAVMGGSGRTIGEEALIMGCFVAMAAIGFRWNLWLVAVALAGHGVLDLFHGHLVTNSGMPAWWPAFCMAYDVVAGAFLAWQLGRSATTASAAAAER